MYKLANITTKKQAESDTEIWNVYFATKKEKQSTGPSGGDRGHMGYYRGYKAGSTVLGHDFTDIKQKIG